MHSKPIWLLSLASNANLSCWKTHTYAYLYISVHRTKFLQIFLRIIVVNRVCFFVQNPYHVCEKGALWNIFFSCWRPWSDPHCLTSIQEQQTSSGMDSSPLRHSGLLQPHLYAQVTPHCFPLHWPEPQEGNQHVPKPSELPCCLLPT